MKKWSGLDRFKSYYLINEDGEVKSTKGKKEKILKPTNDRYVLIDENGDRRCISVLGIKKRFGVSGIKKRFNDLDVNLSELECLEGEEWKWIKGYEGIYAVSTIGRIRSFTSISKGRIKSVCDDGNGYLQTTLWKDGKGVCCKVHRLVGETFIPNPKGLETINHKDFDKTNNSIENLEWLSQSDNTKHYWKNKREGIV